MKTIQILVVSFFISLNAWAVGKTGKLVFLGGAYNPGHCRVLAGQAGFQLATFGGYINGIYYWNACFGSYLSDPTDPSGDWETEVRAALINAANLYWAFQDDKAYTKLTRTLDRLEDNLKLLRRAAEDGLSTESAYSLYRDAQRSYQQLTKEYYPIHQVEKNEDVGRSWRRLAETMKRLDQLFDRLFK